MTSEIGPKGRYSEEAAYHMAKEEFNSDLEKLHKSISLTFRDLPDVPTGRSIAKLREKLNLLDKLVSRFPVSDSNSRILNNIIKTVGEISKKSFFAGPKDDSLRAFPEKLKKYEHLINNIETLKELESMTDQYKFENEAFLRDPYVTLADYDKGKGGDIEPSEIRIDELISQIPKYQTCADECRRLLASLSDLPEEEKLAVETILADFTKSTLPYLLQQQEEGK